MVFPRIIFLRALRGSFVEEWACRESESCDECETREDKEGLSSLNAKWWPFFESFSLFEHVSIDISIENRKSSKDLEDSQRNELFEIKRDRLNTTHKLVSMKHDRLWVWVCFKTTTVARRLCSAWSFLQSKSQFGRSNESPWSHTLALKGHEAFSNCFVVTQN